MSDILLTIMNSNVIYGLPTWSDQAASAGRLVTLEFPKYFLIGTYVPNAGDKVCFLLLDWSKGLC